MKYKLFAVNDVHTGFLAPTLEINESAAIRNFVAGFSGSKVMQQNAKDFDLREIAEFDTITGVIKPIQPKVVYTGSSAYAYLKEIE